MRVASLCGAVLVLISSLALGQDQPRPLNQNEIIALVAGAALPENVVAAIQQRGVNFALQPADEQMLRELGDSTEIIKAIKIAKVLPGRGKPSIPELNDTLITIKRLMKERNLSRAAEDLSAAIKKHPSSDELGFVMAQVLLYKREGLPAVLLYRALLERDPDFPEAHTRMGFGYLLIGEYDEGIAEEQAVLEQNPKNAQAHRIFGDLLEKKGKHDAAITEFQQALNLKPDYSGAYYSLAIVYRDKQDYGQSAAMLRRAIAIEPGNADYHQMRGVVIEEDARHKQFQEKVLERTQAVEEYREAKRLAPSDPTIRKSLGFLLREMRRDSEAEREFRELIKIAPDYEYGYSGLGWTLLTEKTDLKEAETEFKAAIRLDASEPSFHCGLGEVYYQQKRFDDAIRELQRGQEEGCEEGAYWLGRVFLEQHDAARAVVQFRGALRMASDDWRAHYGLGVALEATGDETGAVSEYREASKLFPETPGVHRDLVKLLEKRLDYPAVLEQYTEMIHLHLASYSDLAAARERAQKYLAELRSTGKQTEATELAARLAAFEHSSDENPETGLVAAKESASKAFRERRYSDAENEWKKALEYAERIQPRDSRLTSTLYEYGNFLQAQQRFAEAEGVFRRGISVAEEGSAYELRWQPLYQAMASLCDRRHDIACAEDFYLRDLHMVERLFPDQPFLAGELVAVGGFYFNNQLFDKAEPLFQRALALSAAERPGISSAQTASQLGDIYKARKDYAHAEGYYRQSIKLYQQIEDPGRGNIVHPMDGLIAVLHATGREDEAGDVAKQRQAATPPRPQPVSSK